MLGRPTVKGGTIAAPRARVRRGERDEYVTTFRPLGPDFPTGLLVAQDSDNGGSNQNFKLVAWDLAALVTAQARR